VRIQDRNLAAVGVAHEQPENAGDHDDDPGRLVVAVDDGSRRQIKPERLAEQGLGRARRKAGEEAAAGTLARARVESARSVRGRTSRRSTTGTTIDGTAAL